MISRSSFTRECARLNAKESTVNMDNVCQQLEAHSIDHLVIPTRDYCLASVFSDICQAVDFMHENALSSRTAYVHCKASQGCSTAIIISYPVLHKQMTPDEAYEHVRSIRPRVILAPAQWLFMNTTL